MKRRASVAVLSLSLLLSFISCEVLLKNPEVPNNPVSNFEMLWKTFDERYAFFELKGVNWDSLYGVYRPRIHSSMRNTELFNICVEMLANLEDGHVYLRGDNDRRVYPWQSEFDSRTFNPTSLMNVYLSSGAERADGLIYRVFDGVGYIYYASFTDNLSQVQLDKVFADFSFLGIRSLVIDIRGNSGGNPDNAFRLAERLIPTEREVIHSRVKIGPGRNDFSATEIYTIGPRGNHQFTGPLAIITNQQTFSAANLFVGIMKSKPGLVHVGRQTGGGGGIPAAYSLPNGWTFAYSATILSLPNGYEIERGFIPQFTPTTSSALNLLGRDPILEFTINYMRNNF